MARVYNFSAGPSMLPEKVLKQAQAELLEYGDSGQSVMEMSHRSKWFDAIIKDTEATLRRVMNIPDNYKVGFFQGGATQQFAMVPLNFMTTGKADYLVTGNFSNLAAKEAAKFGEVNIVASSKDKNFTYIPDVNAINYDQDVNGIMVGVDTKIDGNNAKWIVGAAAGFAKGDMNDRSGQVDQDSQTAYIYSSAHFANNVFVDGSLSYSHFNNDLSATMSNGTYVDGSTNSDAWGFGLKAGYDFKLGDAGYVTPYGSVSGLFQSGDDYQLSNDMKVDGQSYDSMRYELGVDAGYTFTYSEDQALTPYFKLAYVYDDSNNDNDVNGDSIDNGTEGSAVRVGLGTQFSFTKNFSAYTDANYLGGGDVDQDWSANVGVKYTW